MNFKSASFLVKVSKTAGGTFRRKLLKGMPGKFAWRSAIAECYFKKVRKQFQQRCCLMKERETRKSKLIKCIKEIKTKNDHHVYSAYCASRILYTDALFLAFTSGPLFFSSSRSLLPFRLESHKEKELIKAPFGFADWNGKWWEWWILIAHIGVRPDSVDC